MLTIDHATLDDLPAIRALLASAALPIDDFDTAPLGDLYLARDVCGHVRGVVGLQRSGSDALLRSSAVASDARSEGTGGMLLAVAEEEARVKDVSTQYVLTTYAAPFFASRGFGTLTRDAAPEGILGTSQFTGLCPTSSASIVKRLTSDTE